MSARNSLRMTKSLTQYNEVKVEDSEAKNITDSNATVALFRYFLRKINFGLVIRLHIKRVTGLLEVDLLLVITNLKKDLLKSIHLER